MKAMTTTNLHPVTFAFSQRSVSECSLPVTPWPPAFTPGQDARKGGQHRRGALHRLPRRRHAHPQGAGAAACANAVAGAHPRFGP